MTKMFKIPFATQGDRSNIPDEVQANGTVSYTQGYSYDYERDQANDPAAKDIEREKMNAIFHDITEAVGEIQSFGFPKWTAEGKPYPIRCVVYHQNKTWQSKVANNNHEPAEGTTWHELKADLNAEQLGVYTKIESDNRYQPLGYYTPQGYSYSKVESDGRYQPKGNFATVESLNSGLSTRLSTTALTQSTGASQSLVMSQAAVTSALQNAVNLNMIYPVGIVVWFAQNKNPNTLFPGTTWKYIGAKGTVRLAEANGSNVFTTGGSDNVVLTVNNMPSHKHTVTVATNSAGGHAHNRGTMNITGKLHVVRRGGGGETTPSGAFSRTNTWNARVGSGGSDDWGGSFDFNAANTWTGETSVSGSHAHTGTGETNNVGSNSPVKVVNAYVALMGWYRES